MATSNNFKKLEKEDQELIPHAPKKIERQVMGVVKTGHFAGNVIELYFTKLIQLFLMLLGVEKEEQSDIQQEDQDLGEER